MTKVKIFRPAKTAMQSGQAKTRCWKLEFESQIPFYVEPLMGWVGSRDTQSQINLTFETREQAIAYAEEHGFTYRVIEPHHRKMRAKSYADNFRFNQVRKTS